MCAAVVAPTQEHVAEKLAELNLPLDPTIEYNLPTLFPKVDGWLAKGPVKKKAKLIRLLEPTLQEILHPGEEVLYVAKGVQQSFLESVFIGAMWAAMLNQTVFVLTNLRVIMIRSKSNGTPLHQFWIIFYSEIQKLQSSWTGTIVLKLNDGKKRSFSGIPKEERKTMSRVFEDALAEYRERGFAPETSQSMETMCPHCYEIVPYKESDCESCQATFWKPTELAVRSLIFPSWGDFLMKHYWFAAFEFLGYLLGLFIFAAPMLSPNPPPLAESVIGLIFFFVFAHMMDALLTYIVAQKGLYTRTDPDGHLLEEVA